MKKLLIGFFLFLTIFVISNKNAQASCSCIQGCDVGTCEDFDLPPPSCEPVCGNGYVAKAWGEGCVVMKCSCLNTTSTTCCPEPTTPPPEDTPTLTNTPIPCPPQTDCSNCDSHPGYRYNYVPTDPPACSWAPPYPSWPDDYTLDPSCVCATPTPTLPPGNTPTPITIPTSTPGLPTPTPIQPTEIINLVLPPSEAFSKKAASEIQNWVCLKTTPCSTGGLICSGGDPRHRVRIATKTDTKLIPNKKTYIFECLQTDQGFRCTTGNGTLDQNLTGANYLSSLSSAYGYRFVSFTDIQNKPIQQFSPNQVVITDSKGSLGPLEWESSTTVQVGRMMMAMQQVLESDLNITGHAASQQLGTFYLNNAYNTTCVMIKWDPHGTVFDINNLKPIEGVKVTLLHKNKNNDFEPVKTSDVFNGLENPQVTSSDGKYAFSVPDGTYKLELEKEGYQPVFDVVNINKNVWDAYPQLYDGGEIVTKGEFELRNLAMKKITFGEKTLNFFQGIWLKIKNGR